MAGRITEPLRSLACTSRSWVAAVLLSTLLLVSCGGSPSNSRTSASAPPPAQLDDFAVNVEIGGCFVDPGGDAFLVATVSNEGSAARLVVLYGEMQLRTQERQGVVTRQVITLRRVVSPGEVLESEMRAIKGPAQGFDDAVAAVGCRLTGGAVDHETVRLSRAFTNAGG
jgi:hypothetical protein